MLRDLLKFQNTIYLAEDDLQDARKEAGTTLSLVKTGVTAYKKEAKEDYSCKFIGEENPLV